MSDSILNFPLLDTNLMHQKNCVKIKINCSFSFIHLSPFLQLGEFKTDLDGNDEKRLSHSYFSASSLELNPLNLAPLKPSICFLQSPQLVNMPFFRPFATA